MRLHFRPAYLALALAVTAGPACAQTWLYESDYGARAYYQPRVVYHERFLPRAYYNAYAYEPVVAARAVAVAPARRTVITRTITERTVTVTTAPVIRPRVVARAAVTDAYAWAPARRVVTRPITYGYRPAVTEAYAWAPAPAARVVTRPITYGYGPAVTDAYAYAPPVRPAVTTVPVVTNVPVVTTVPVVQTYQYVNPLAYNPLTGVFLSDE